MTGERTVTQSELLAIWERGEREEAGTRGLLLLAGACTAPDDELAIVPAGRRDALLLDFRERLFGPDFAGITSCPACGEAIELTFDASEVRRGTPQAETAVVNAGAFEVELRLPTAGDLAAIDSLPDVSSARTVLFDRCVLRAGDGDGAVAAIDLPAQVVQAVVARMAELDPQADVAIDVACPACAHAWREPFDVVTFLWGELAAWARRLLADVHLLASAYGWSEGDILGLTAVRRDAYLEMLR